MDNDRNLPDWMKIPRVLQNQFFKHAKEEAERCKIRLNERFKRIKSLEKEIEKKSITKSDEWKKWKIGVVDGSNSPVTSERVGSRFGVLCAGYLIFKGDQVVDEGYESDEFVQDQIGSQDIAESILSIMRVGLERKVALNILEEKELDLILIDGSFFGFRAEAHKINDEIIEIKGFEKGSELTSKVRDDTLKLLNSKKAIGIIKRSRTSAFDGWIIKKYGNDSKCIFSNDRFILSFLLPKGKWFAYSWLFKPEIQYVNSQKVLEKSKTDYNYYTRLHNMYRYKIIKKKEKISIEKLFDYTAQALKRSIRKSMLIDHSRILRTSRYYIRCSNSFPFEFETHLDIDVKPILSYFKGFHNPATGLPWPIDLVDEKVSLPKGFTREFVEEIEAELIRDSDINDKIALHSYFSSLNPQKEED